VSRDFQKLNNQLVLELDQRRIQFANRAITGPFTNLPGATSPYTNPITSP
jgi:hypothetical protein